MFDPKCLELARVFFGAGSEFPASKHEALLQLLAQDIQDEIEGFFEYPDLTLKHLERTEQLARERAADPAKGQPTK